MSASNGRVIEAPDIRQNLKDSNPDTRLEDRMRLMANATGALLYVGGHTTWRQVNDTPRYAQCRPYNAKLVVPPQIPL